MAKKTSKKEPKAVLHREGTLGYLAGEYSESLLYTAELKRAIDSFRGEIPTDSPYRYVRMDVGGAIQTYLQEHSPQTVDNLIAELLAGGCVLGAVKTPKEIVTKAVKALIQNGQVEWADRAETQVRMAKAARNRSPWDKRK